MGSGWGELGEASGVFDCYPSGNASPQVSTALLLYLCPCLWDRLQCAFQFWLLQIPLGLLAGSQGGGGGRSEMVGGGGEAL